MRVFVHLHIDAQLVAAHHAARRMHEVYVAGITFGVEGPLDDERTFVMALDEARSSRSRCGPICQ
jgi:hypothetical protein